MLHVAVLYCTSSPLLGQYRNPVLSRFRRTAGASLTLLFAKSISIDSIVSDFGHTCSASPYMSAASSVLRRGT